MATVNITVPNWAQEQLAKAVGLDPAGIAVRHEDDRNITFLQYCPRQEVLVCKVTGKIIYS